jgi:hypothetical protein
VPVIVYQRADQVKQLHLVCHEGLHTPVCAWAAGRQAAAAAGPAAAATACEAPGIADM